jgi:hypothetical protein
MNRKLIARQLILEAKKLLAAGKKDSDYVYDPDHKHKPKGGHWEKTEKGWSQKKEEKKKKKLSTKEQEKIAKNPNTPVDTLVELSKDEDRRTRAAVAKNPNTPDDILVELSKDEEVDIKECVAKNPNTPVDILVELSKDKESWTR